MFQPLAKTHYQELQLPTLLSSNAPAGVLAPPPTSFPFLAPAPPSLDVFGGADTPLPPPPPAEATLFDGTEDSSTDEERRRAAATAAAEALRPRPDRLRPATVGCSEIMDCFSETVKRPSEAFLADASNGFETCRVTVWRNGGDAWAGGWVRVYKCSWLLDVVI